MGLTRREGRQRRVNSNLPGHRSEGRMAETTGTAPTHRLRARAEAAVASMVDVRPSEMPPLTSVTSTFFFISHLSQRKILTPWMMHILSAYFMVLPLWDEGAISLGLGALPGLFAARAHRPRRPRRLPRLHAPIRSQALVLIHRFFSISLLVFFMLWFASKPGSPTTAQSSEDSLNKPAGWGNHSWFYIGVRISFSWVALLNLITISSTRARVIDVMDSESGSRLFGFIGAVLLLFSSLLMELAALSSKGICIEANHGSAELPSTGAEPSQNTELGDEMSSLVPSPRTPSQSQKTKPGIFVMFEVTIVATTISSPTARSRTFALINSFIAVFILAGQLTLTISFRWSYPYNSWYKLAIYASPFIVASNLVALPVWPTWVAIAVTKTIQRQVTAFTVVAQHNCLEILVRSPHNATAAPNFVRACPLLQKGLGHLLHHFYYLLLVTFHSPRYIITCYSYFQCLQLLPC
ncbi:hypothetical protein ZWY2020_020461 [Hordeum vulgare]|nr:hypothetical protein ZWY2020_020461 [Hordeum vulgare]